MAKIEHMKIPTACIYPGVHAKTATQFVFTGHFATAFVFDSFVCPELQMTLSRDNLFQFYCLKKTLIIGTSNKFKKTIIFYVKI